MRIPTIKVSGKGANRLRNGQIWVFSSDLAERPQIEAGETVAVRDPAGTFIGYAWYSHSKLALRLVTREDKIPDRDLYRSRLESAISRRQPLIKDRDAMRLVHGESDLLPGLLVDRFGAGLVIQTLCQATDNLKPVFIELLEELLSPKTIVVRDDGLTRDYENLPRIKTIAHGSDPQVIYHEGALQFEINLLTDQKTGAFLDQYENHLLARNYARGQVLDLFCYHGGFGLQMSKTAEGVTCVDQSQEAIDRVVFNAGKNGLSNITAIAANAFDFLRLCESEKKKFSVIVIDPGAAIRN